MTPQLRFPEFTDEWQSKSLGSLVAQMQSGLSRRLSSEDIGLPVIRSNNIKGQSIDVSDISYWYINDPQGAKISNYILEYDDLLVNFINSISQIGKFAIYNNEAGRDTIFTTNIMRLKFKDGVDSRFIAHKFSTKRYNDYIDSITKPAVNQASFTTVDFKKFTIPLPSNQEQEKIAKFLTAVDKRIAAGEKKLELLKKYKKGVMQKIFTQTVRFKDENGNPYPEWEEKRLGDVFDEVKRKAGETKAETYSITAGIGFVSQRSKFGKDISGNQNKSYTLLRENEFSFNKGNSKTYTYGCVYANKEGGDIAVPNVFISFKLRNKDMSTDFFEQLFIGHYLDRYLRKIISSGARMDGLLNVSKADFFAIKVPVPASKEQQKIATFLTALDDKIAAEQTSLTAAKQWKKGLLQRMFV